MVMLPLAALNAKERVVYVKFCKMEMGISVCGRRLSGAAYAKRSSAGDHAASVL